MTRNLGALASSALLLAAVSTQAHAGPNLVLNGNFATGDFTDWTLGSSGVPNAPEEVIALTGGNFPPDNLTVGSPQASAGFAARFLTDTGSQTLSQTISLGIGTYSIGFDLSVPANGFANPHNATFSASIAGTPLLSSASVAAIGAADGTDTWVNETSVATVTTPGLYTVDFTFTGSTVPAKDVLVDRVFVVAGNVLAPEPDSLVLLAVPLLGLVMLRRRSGAAPQG